MLGGCGIPGRPQPQNDSFSRRETLVVFPSSYEKTEENVSFKTEIMVDPDFSQDRLVAASVKLKLPDAEKVKEQFKQRLEGKKIKEEFNEPPTDKSPFAYYSMLTEDIYSLSIARGVAYRTSFAGYFYNTLRYDERGNFLEEYRGIQEIEGMPEEEILLKAKTEMEGIGYSMEGDITSFALPHKLLAQEESWMSSDGSVEFGSYKEAWTDDDDTWYFLMRQKHQGLPVYHQYVYPDCSDQNAPVRIAYSRRGLESLEVDYFFEFERHQEPQYLVGFDKIAETAAEKYNDLLTESDYVVSKATLYEAVVQLNSREYMVTPAWLLNIVESTGDTSYYFTMLIDAVTGEEIIS